MKTPLSILLAFLLSTGAVFAAPPKPTTSPFFQSEIAGMSWRADGSGAALFLLSIPDSAPEVMYVEALLPNPDEPKRPEVIRKKVVKKDGRASFEGPVHAKWRSATYTYLLKVFSDDEYTKLLGQHVQPTQIMRPPARVLRQLRK